MRGGWHLHSICVAVLAAQVGLWALGHTSTRSLEETVRKGTPDERVAAIQILLERGEADSVRYGGLFASDLMADEDPRVVDLAFTTTVTKHSGTAGQYRYLRNLQEAGRYDATYWRAFVLLRRKIGVIVGGSSGRLKLRELEWWFDAIEDRPLPGDELARHVRENP